MSYFSTVFVRVSLLKITEVVFVMADIVWQIKHQLNYTGTQYLHTIPGRQVTMDKMSGSQVGHAFRYLVAEVEQISNGKALKQLKKINNLYDVITSKVNY